MGKIMVDGLDFSGVYMGAHPQAKDQLYDKTNSVNITDDNVQDAIDRLDEAIGNMALITNLSDGTLAGAVALATTMAEGASNAMVFDTIAAMQAWLKNSANANTAVVGDHIYIKDTSVADYWISAVLTSADATTGYYYEITELATGKVDLTSYDATLAAHTASISKLQTDMTACFQSVSDGKALVANAITGKGVTTAANAEFATMASNIASIKTNPKLQDKSATLNINSTSVTLSPDSGYDGLSSANVSISVQSKNASLSTVAQTIVPDNGKLLSAVTIPAVPGTATSPGVLAGTTFSGAAGIGISGSMANRSGATVAASNVTNDGNTVTITVPGAAYYDTTSKITVPSSSVVTTSAIQNHVKSVTTSFGGNNDDDTSYTVFRGIVPGGIYVVSMASYSGGSHSASGGTILSSHSDDIGYNLGVYTVTILATSTSIGASTTGPHAASITRVV